MIELEKENYIENSIHDIYNIAKNYIDKKAQYEDMKNYFPSIGSIIFSLSFFGFFVSLFVISLYYLTDAFINSLYYFSLKLALFSFGSSLTGLFIALLGNHLPFFKNDLQKRSLIMEEAFNKDISQQDQFNYLLFIDMLIHKCSIENSKFKKIKNKLLKIKNDMPNLCLAKNKEKLFNFIFKNHDFLINTSKDIEGFNEEIQENEQFNNMYDNFVKQIGVFSENKQATQKVRNIL